MLNRQTLTGNWGTVLLPLDIRDKIDFRLLEEQLEYMIYAGVDGVYSNGTAGELHNISESEFFQIQEIVADKCRRSHLNFQLGINHPFASVTYDRITELKVFQPSAFQLIMPDWVPLNQQEQIDFLLRAAELADGIPLVLYNPPHSKVKLVPSDFLRLADAVKQLIGIKVAGGDSHWYRQMEWSRNCFSVFVPGHSLASGYKTGIADGAYSNVACLHPLFAQKWWELMKIDLDAGLEIEKRIHSFFEECILPLKAKGFSNPALDKLLAAIGGWSAVSTRLRHPYNWIPQDEVSSIRSRALYWLPELITFQTQ